MSETKRAEVEGCSIVLRPLRPTDLWSIHRMCDSLSEESKHFFSVRIFGFKSLSWRWCWYWVLGQGVLILSCHAITRNLLRRLYTKASYFVVVAANDRSNRIIGFAYLHGDKLPQDFFLSICVHDFYQGLGVGSNLMARLIKWARSAGAQRINLSVATHNVKAVSLYKKFGFRPASDYPSMTLDMTLDIEQR